MSGTLLITGVGQRIGQHLAEHLQAQGYQVIGTYRTDRPSLAELSEQGVELVQCDFNQPAQVTELVEKVRHQSPVLRGIIHNASDWLPDSGAETAVATLHAMMQVHVAVPYQLNLALQEQLMASEVADIIHLTDYVAEKGSRKHIAYAASKAALANMTLSFAQLLAPKVKVNSIAPALILFNEDDSEEYKQKARAKSLMNKEAGADEMLQTVDYLLQSRYVTGRSLAVDGGRHLK
ncbi:dihydromonapterin reductase [Nitrincola sp. A-D6]|uniref:dihydromonapterin reductase n=1 Tax=Nitrincola sp. A-D6 TaxID=1545442 RepID=UPI00051FB95C|nr:dihydromonapterin reductase [Nitrincola sp. A-D6]KGK41801.1 dihydromonapterin reductase [Nitrincola sp. A-D6]